MKHQNPILSDANGFPIATRSLLLTTVADNDAMVDFIDLDDTFSRYVVEIDNLAPNGDGDLEMRVSFAADFKTGVADYSWTVSSHQSNFGVGTNQDNSDDVISLNRNAGTVRWGSQANENGDVSVMITRGDAGFYPRVLALSVSNNDDNQIMLTHAAGVYRGLTSTPSGIPSGGIDGIRFFFRNGTTDLLIQQGNFRLYGVE